MGIAEVERLGRAVPGRRHVIGGWRPMETVSFQQVKSDEQKAQAGALIRAYLNQLDERVQRDYGLAFDVEAVVEPLQLKFVGLVKGKFRAGAFSPGFAYQPGGDGDIFNAGAAG
jgi:hypothetical protein